MDTDNTKRDAEPSPASAGSQPVAWAAISDRIRVMGVTKESVEEEVKNGEKLAPLYLTPQPTLTAAELAAIRDALDAAKVDARLFGDRAAKADAAALRGLLKRLG